MEVNPAQYVSVGSYDAACTGNNKRVSSNYVVYVSIYRVISQLLLNQIVFLSLDSWDEREMWDEFHILYM